MQERYSIFASVGNSTQPFDRLLRMVDEAAERTGLRTIVQTGTGLYHPRFADAVQYVTRERFDELARAADYIVIHAGVGSVMTAVRLGKLPIIVPRRKERGESVNDHQMEVATELPRLGWCRLASSVDDLLNFLQAPPAPVPLSANTSNQLMRELVTEFIG